MSKMVAGIIVVVLLALAGYGAWYLMSARSTGSGTPESVIVGTPPNEIASLIFIAEDQGFFIANGLNVTIKNYDSALNAVSGMENGESDISVSTEYPIVRDSFKKANISVIGCIDKYQTTFLIGRNDRGIENMSDLKGKKIGVSRGGIGEFYLGRFLDLHGMSLQEVTLIDIKLTLMMDSLANGSVDAAMIWNIDANTAEDQLGSDVVVWPAQSEQTTFSLITCRNDWARSHPEAINRLLKSLARAEEYSISHPSEAQSIIQKRLNYTDVYMATLWPNHHFSLTLDQSLVTAMEDEGRWMINNNLTTEQAIPDYRNCIYTKSLVEVKPEAGNIW